MGRILRSRVLYLLLAAIALATLGRQWLDSVGGPGVLRERFGFWGLAVSFPLHVGSVVGFGGEELIAMANGLAYGFVLGSAATWLGWFTGSGLRGLGKHGCGSLGAEFGRRGVHEALQLKPNKWVL
jgi:hypothetical protein